MGFLEALAFEILVWDGFYYPSDGEKSVGRVARTASLEIYKSYESGVITFIGPTSF